MITSFLDLELQEVFHFRLEAHQGIVECNIGLQRHREAANAATEACKQFNNSPRALTLYATALLKVILPYKES